jgi:phosphoribosylglycinamide formyltransferase-1
MARKRVAILISGRGSNMVALIEAAKASDFPAEIALVLSNKADAGGIASARESGIATEVVEHKPFGKDREAFDRAVQAKLEAHRIELVCLAGFLRILSPWLVSQWTGRMINIHPSLLPAFKGLHTHERAIAEGATRHGATVHFVVPALDAGPVILQESVPVLLGDTADMLAARVLEVEHRIYPQALRMVAEGRAGLGDR